MRSLVYVSSATVEFSSADLLELLAKARTRNRDAGVTGMLLYKKGSFIQVLEGADEAVHNVYARVSRDTRHSGCLQLLDQPLETRQFASWEMGFRDLSDPSLASTPGFSSFLNVDFLDDRFRTDPGRAMRLLNTFRRTTS